MEVLEDADLKARLPFPESQDVLYQFHCMLGTQESWLLEGRMKGWDCSLTPVSAGELLPVTQVRKAMEAADVHLLETLEGVDWLSRFQDGNTPLAGYFRLVEHEAHHHGQGTYIPKYTDCDISCSRVVGEPTGHAPRRAVAPVPRATERL